MQYFTDALKEVPKELLFALVLWIINKLSSQLKKEKKSLDSFKRRKTKKRTKRLHKRKK